MLRTGPGIIPRMNPTSKIVQNLFKKKELLESGDSAHTAIRPVLIVLGGGMRGVSGGGAACALNLLGLNQVFDMAIGASAGAPITAYFLAGTEQTYLGTSIFYDELRGRNFINLYNFSEIANIEWLGKAFAEGSKKLDTQSVVAHRTPLFISFTDYIDGTEQLFSVKDHPDSVVEMLKISSAIPFLYKRKMCFDGRQYLDGSVAFSVRRTLESPLLQKVQPTDVLLITNTEQRKIHNPETEFVEHVAHYFSHHFERLLLRRIQLADDLAYLSSLTHINIGVIPGPETDAHVGNLTSDPKKLWTLGNETLKSTLEAFGRPDLLRELTQPMQTVLKAS